MRSSWSAASALFLIGQIQGAIWTNPSGVITGQNARNTANSLNRLVNTDAYTRGTDSIHFNDAYVQQFGLDLWTDYNTPCRQNILANGGFHTGDLTGWSGVSYNNVASVPDPTVISIVGGRARVTNSAGHTFANMQFAMTGMTIGGSYSTAGDVLPVQPGRIRITTNADGTSGIVADTGTLASNASVAFSFVATAATMYFNMFAYSGVAGSCDYDNVVVKGISVASSQATDDNAIYGALHLRKKLNGGPQ
jgi:hypothetical protein